MKKLSILITTIVTLFAVAANAQPSLDKLEKQLDKLASPKDATDIADPPGYLGLVGDNPADGLRGVQVITLKTLGPAAKAGIQPGDRIVAIGRHVIGSLDDMSAVLGKLRAGDVVVIELSRGGRRIRAEVTLAARADPAASAPPDISKSLPEPRTRRASTLLGRPMLGVNVTSVTDETRTRYGLVVRSGALIGKLRADSSADRAGLSVGNVIVAIDGRRVDVPSDLVKQLAVARPGEDVEISYYDGDRFLRRTARLDSGRDSSESPALPIERKLSTPAKDGSALRRIEEFIDGLTPKKPPKPIPSADEKDEGPKDDVEILKRQVELLKTQIEQLQRRVRELEDRGGA